MIDLFHELIEKIFDENISLVQLREKNIDIENIFSGNYDYYIPPAQLNQCLEIMFNLLSQKCINFSINKMKFGKTKVIIYAKNNINQYIHLELWNHLEVKDSLGQASKYIFEDTLNTIIYKDKNAYKLSLKVEALYYLSYLHTKSKNLDSPEVIYQVEYYKAKSRDLKEVHDLYLELLSTHNISKTSHKANMILIDLNILEKESLIDSKVLSVTLKKVLVKTNSKILKCIKIVPVVGPDGVGKTSLIEDMILNIGQKVQYYRFKRLFRKSFIYHILYRYLTKKSSKKVDKNSYDDEHGVFIIFISLMRYPMLMLNILFSLKIIFSDRYFHDYILKNTRAEDERIVLRKKWKFLLKMIPNLYWFIQLDAPSDIILARKQEMSKNDIEMYRKLMFKLYLNKPSMVYTYINTKNDLNECTNILKQEAKNNGLLK